MSGHVVILGAGTGGTLAANRLRRALGADVRISVVDQDDDHVAVDRRRVHLADGTLPHYDVLVVATGARLLPEETEGLTGPGWSQTVHTFYDLSGATALREFDHGRLVVNVVDLPIRCPVAPLEFCFLADWFLRERGVRDDVQLTYVTPLDAAFTKPSATAEGVAAQPSREADVRLAVLAHSVARQGDPRYPHRDADCRQAVPTNH